MVCLSLLRKRGSRCYNMTMISSTSYFRSGSSANLTCRLLLTSAFQDTRPLRWFVEDVDLDVCLFTHVQACSIMFMCVFSQLMARGVSIALVPVCFDDFWCDVGTKPTWAAEVGWCYARMFRAVASLFGISCSCPSRSGVVLGLHVPSKMRPKSSHGLDITPSPSIRFSSSKLWLCILCQFIDKRRQLLEPTAPVWIWGNFELWHLGFLNSGLFQFRSFRCPKSGRMEAPRSHLGPFWSLAQFIWKLWQEWIYLVSSS